MKLESELIATGQTCPYCLQPSVLVGADVVYGGRYKDKYVYLCHPCNAYVGCHPGTVTALGSLANEELRRWRQAAHSYFDPLWRTYPRKRTAAYAWMARSLGISKDEAHIGLFNIEMCQRLIKLCKPFYK